MRGYRVSQSKAQIALSEVQYLGFHIRQGERQLSNKRKEAICQVPIPSKRLRAFLGMAGFCRIWIPEFGLWAKPLYKCVKGAEHDPFHRSPEADRAFQLLGAWKRPTEKQEHGCLEIIDVQYSSRPDLKDQPLPNADLEWYTDGSSTVVDGQRRAGYAVVSLHDTVEAESLPAGTSAQLAELVALTRALELAKDKRVNIFTDSKYAFGVLHAYAGLWKQREMLTAQGSPVKHGSQILRLLEAVQLPSAVAVVHCKVHQREDQDVTKGNARADKEAKRAATLKSPTEENAQMHALIPSVGELAAPQYSQEDRNLADSLGLQEKEGWLYSTEGKILLPKGLIQPVL
uniref:RNase H type-1 domain-containing protein n=1 Tax=Terrapene triunguis TaxID=2587831 RepID=A0A674J3X5_9SAUR